MLRRIPWKESFSVGVPAIDTQHRKLLDILNDLAQEDDAVRL